MKKLVVVLIAVLFTFSGMAQKVNFNAQKSQLKWTGKKVTGEHWGYIQLKSGEIELKDGRINSGTFIINMATLTCEDLEPGEWHDKLVGHLKSEDFFNVANYKEAILEITNSTPFKNDKAKVNGKLTIKGITHPISFDAVKTDNGYAAKVVVDRTKYDIKYGSGKFFEGLGDKMIYDEFTLDVTISK